MLGEEEELRAVQVRGQGRSRSAVAAAAVTITTAGGEVLTISEFISRMEETTSRRLNSMDQVLKDLEKQMGALEVELGKANDQCFEWS